MTDTLYEEQSRLISMMKATRIENNIILDTALRSALRVFVGERNTGVHFTALAAAGISSQGRTNSLVIDFTGSNKLEAYGLSPIEWDEFISSTPQSTLCGVKVDNCTPEKMGEILTLVEEKLLSYGNISFIFYTDQVDIASPACDRAIVIHTVTDSKPENIESIKAFKAQVNPDNCAWKFVMIAPAISIADVCLDCGFSINMTKLVEIPFMKEAQVCRLKGILPHLKDKVNAIYKQNMM